MMKQRSNFPVGAEWKKKFQLRSIQSKLMLLLLISVVTTSMLVGVVCLAETSDILRSTAEDNMVLICERGTETINTKLVKIEEQVKTMSHRAETDLSDPSFAGDAAAYENFLAQFETVGKNHASSAEGIIGVFAIFDYSALGLSAPFGFSYRLDGHGTFTPDVLSDYYDGSNLPDWYNRPVRERTSLWLETAPHTAGKYTTSYVTPILLGDGSCVGVVGVSCETKFLETASSDFKGFKSGFNFVLNSDNSILYHPNVKNGTTHLQSRPKFHPIEGNEQAEKSGVSLFTYEHEGDDRYLSYSTLRNGKKLCISASQSEIYQWQSDLIVSSLLIFLAVVLLSLGVATWFAKFLTRPIKALNTAAKDMLEGNLETELVPTTADEIGDLTRILNRARERIKFQINDLYNEAHHDGLTGIPNKTAFCEAERRLDRQIEYGKASFVLAIIDVNRLKITNDFFGHSAGDALLRSVANHLKAAFDPHSVFRIGGDEFAVLLQGQDPEAEIASIERCISRLHAIHLSGFPDVSVSCAVGIAAHDRAIDTCFNDTLKRADNLMYRNKGEIKREAPAFEGGKGLKQLQTEKFLEFLSILSQSTEDYLFLYEFERNKTHFFGKLLEKYRIPQGEDGTITVENMAEAIHPACRAKFMADIEALIDEKKEEHDLNYRLFTNEGTAVWVNCRGHVIKADNQPILLVGRISDTVLRPWYSPITGLFNRNRFLQDMQPERVSQFGAFMLLDIDNMANLNLKLGREEGDQLLRLLAETLEEQFPEAPLYHMEKDRFVVPIKNADNADIKARFDATLAKLDGKLTASAAVLPYNDSLYIDENSIYEYATQLLKETKGQKVGKIYFFTREDFSRKITSIDLLDELRRSVANNFEGFFVVYQPQVAANGYSIAGAEALLRYRSPSRGVISPAEFIPLLERSRLINKVGLFVCEEALRKCKKWRETLPDFRIAVNFSSVQLLEDETDERVLSLLGACGLPGDALVVELTESIQVESTEVAEAFERFRAEGIRIAIDDFGTGYANLAYLKKIHADEIKIDRIFIKDIKESSYNYMVICNILEFAKQNGFHVCLEGVETAEELSIVDELGADTLQGYLFSRPITDEEFEKLYVKARTPKWRFMGQLLRHKEQAHLVRFNTRDILANVHIGLWVIRTDKAEGSCKLFGDVCMQDLLGVDPDGAQTPEECYSHWYSRIKPGHEGAVNAMVEAMAQNPNKVFQTIYPWIHPTLGEITVRCTGKCVHNENGVTIFEGFHRNMSEVCETYTNIADAQ